MNENFLVTSTKLLIVLVSALFFLVSNVQANEKPKVISGNELSADSLVDTLDIGEGTTPKEEKLLTRGFKPIRPSVARASQESSGGGAASGKAPLMVTFKTGSAELTNEGISMLSKVAEALQSERLSGFSFVVEGHADPRGEGGSNLKLSQSRADSVARHLTTQHGVLAARLRPVGRGSADLYDPVRTDAPENRRVTLVTVRQ